jgi:hypothetical protein
MKRNVVTCLAVASCLSMAPPSAHAHHSYGMFFDLCQSVTIDGRVESIQWSNPHVWIDLKGDDGTAYGAEWTSLTPNGAGPARDMLKPGDRLVITGSSVKDPTLKRGPALPIDPDGALLRYLAVLRDPARKVVSALTQVRRVSDGWSWGRSPGPPPPECADQ